MSKLKPCPFCGGNAELYFDTKATKDTEGHHWAYQIVCDNCCATTGICCSSDDAVNAWNRRDDNATD